MHKNMLKVASTLWLYVQSSAMNDTEGWHSPRTRSKNTFYLFIHWSARLTEKFYQRANLKKVRAALPALLLAVAFEGAAEMRRLVVCCLGGAKAVRPIFPAKGPIKSSWGKSILLPLLQVENWRVDPLESLGFFALCSRPDSWYVSSQSKDRNMAFSQPFNCPSITTNYCIWTCD